jgi:protein CpxP
MTFNPTRLGLLAGAALVLTLAGAAQAADAPPPKVERKVIIMGGPGGDMMGPGMRGGPRGEKMDPAKHAQHLRDVLQLRPDQEGALQAFLKTMEPPKDMPDMPRMDGPMTTPQRLDMMVSMMTEHVAMMQNHVAAVKAFYAQLSPSQQKAFDALHEEMMGGMGGEKFRIMRRGPHGPGGPDGDMPPPPPPGE